MSDDEHQGKQLGKPIILGFLGLMFLAAVFGGASDPSRQKAEAQSVPSASPSASTTPVTAASEDDTKNRCRKAIMARSKHPSTVDIHSFTGYATATKPDGTRAVKQTFSEKNDYGLELTFEAYCELGPGGKFWIMVEERRPH